MMHLPLNLRLSLLVSVCAAIFSGFALAGAAFARNGEMLAVLAAVFVLVSVGAPLFLGRRIERFLQEQDGAPVASLAARALMPEPPAEPAGFTVPEELPASEDEEALRRTQKAQAVDLLRDGITHDLNNRLMVISANIDSVARQMKEQPILQRKLLSALVASDQAAKLIAKSADFARQSEPRIQYLDLAECVNSVSTLMSRSFLRDTVELRLFLDEELWPVEADRDDIETALVTLSGHVRDALPQGGAIILEAQNVQVRRGSLPNLKIEGDFVQLVIRNNGTDGAEERPGEPEEDGFSLRDMDLSSWLSLKQGLRFLRSLGGASEVRHDGSETAIVLYLPRADAATLLPPGPLPDDDVPSEAASNHAEILVVDDEVEVALALQSMLDEFGYVTRIATDAAQAMKSLKARKPRLVLADVAMPGVMNGAMLAREVRHIFPDLPVLLITGSPVAADEAGEFPLLQKPIISRDLHAAIQRHLVVPDENKVVPLFPRAHRA